MVDTCIYEVASNYICVGINKAMVGVVVIISARSIKPMGDSGGSMRSCSLEVGVWTRGSYKLEFNQENRDEVWKAM